MRARMLALALLGTTLLAARASAQEDLSSCNQAKETLARRTGLVSLRGKICELKDAPTPVDWLERAILEDPPAHASPSTSEGLLRALYARMLEAAVLDAAQRLVTESRATGWGLPDAWARDAVSTCGADVQALVQSAMQGFHAPFLQARKGAIEKQRASLGKAVRPDPTEVERIADGADRSAVVARVRATLAGDRALLEEVAAEADEMASRLVAQAVDEVHAQAGYLGTADPAGVEEGEIAEALRRGLEGFCAGRLYGPFPGVSSRGVPSRAAELAQGRFLQALPGELAVDVKRVAGIVASDLGRHMDPEQSLAAVCADLESELRGQAIEKYAARVPPERRAEFTKYLDGVLGDDRGTAAFKSACRETTRVVLLAVREKIRASQQAAFPGLIDETWEPEESRVVEAMRGALLKLRFDEVAAWPGVHALPGTAPAPDLLAETRVWVVERVRARLDSAYQDLRKQIDTIETLRPTFQRSVEATLREGRADAREAVVAECIAVLEHEWTQRRGSSGRGLYEHARTLVQEIVAKYFKTTSPLPREPPKVPPVRQTPPVDHPVVADGSATGTGRGEGSSGGGRGPGGGSGGPGTGGAEGGQGEDGGSGGVGGCPCGPGCACRKGGVPDGCGVAGAASQDGTGEGLLTGGGEAGGTSPGLSAGTVRVLAPSWWLMLLLFVLAIVATAIVTRWSVRREACPGCGWRAGNG